ncbi:hypothetical protein BGW80DRAFT_1457596 [Lactifluus volemus]|nr:hypothetical protein BGW80DRAFT_1457596 [Lactifluus volemus]
MPDKKAIEGRARCETADQNDHDYDIYLFWPSLSNRDFSSDEAPSSPLYGPVSVHSESTDFGYSGLDSGPPSPITFSPAPDFRFPFPVKEGLLSPDITPASPQAEPQTEVSTPPQGSSYSAMFKMGLFLSQITRRLDRAVEGVKLKLRKSKS